MNQTNPNAAFLIIGDEILSGRTKDENLNFLANELSKLGVSLREVRVVADVEIEIIEALNALRKKFDYVFTSGGIGPTHDDITSAAIAKAFGQNLVENFEAKNLLKNYYGEENLNEARLKMALIPASAKLLDKNDVVLVPGFFIENVFVFAGIPKIFKSMFSSAKSQIKGGKKTEFCEIQISLVESLIAKDFGNLQQKFPQVLMGSYPSENKTSLVFRSTNYQAIEESANEMIEILKAIKSDAIFNILKS